MPVVTRRMRLMEGRATLGGILTHDVMDHVMEHLSLTDCFQLRAISKQVGTPLGLGPRLDAELASVKREWRRRSDEEKRFIREYEIHHQLLLSYDDEPIDEWDGIYERLYATDTILAVDAKLACEDNLLAISRVEHVERVWDDWFWKLRRVDHTQGGICRRTMLLKPPPVIYLGA